MAYKDKEKRKKWIKDHKEELRAYKKKWDGEHPKNLALHRKYIVKKHREYMERWKEYFHKVGKDLCSICRYNRCFDALDFHEKVPRLSNITPSDWMRNRPPSEKNMKITENWQSLCANCHRELHYNERIKKNDKD